MKVLQLQKQTYSYVILRSKGVYYMDQKFYVCKHCGNIIAYTKNTGVPVMCCGEKMQELVPNTTDAAQEKHVPVIVQDKNKVIVRIGSVPHPMAEEHFIEWICLHTVQGNQRKCLKPGDQAGSLFCCLWRGYSRCRSGLL